MESYCDRLDNLFCLPLTVFIFLFTPTFVFYVFVYLFLCVFLKSANITFNILLSEKERVNPLIEEKKLCDRVRSYNDICGLFNATSQLS